MNRRQKIIVSVTGIFLVLLLLVGLTYAYFLTQINGNENSKSISVSTANLALVYGDGNGVLKPDETIVPGTTVSSKTFTVKNEGNAESDYAVILENFNVTYATTSGDEIAGAATSLSHPDDFKLIITCTSDVEGKTCNALDDTLPTTNDILVTNKIAVGETQSYELSLEYEETGTDQSADMNKTLEGKINIIDTKSTIDIKGTVASYSNGDYVQINSVPKVSQLTSNGEYKVTGVEPGSHTIEVYSSDGTKKATQSIEIIPGEEAGVSGNVITMTEESRTATIDITDIYEIKINENVSDINPFSKGTLAYAILENAKTAVDNNDSIKTIYSPTPLTKPGTANKETEKTLSEIEENGGISYYFRGNVRDNYVTFNNMCWRIVRIENDGSVKLVLESSNGGCEWRAFNTKNTSIGIGNYGYREEIKNGATIYFADYENGNENSMKYKLDNWLNLNFTTLKQNLLKEDNWCLGYSNEYRYVYDSNTQKYNLITQDYFNQQIDKFNLEDTAFDGNVYHTNLIYASLSCDKQKSIKSKIGGITTHEILLAGGVLEQEPSTYYLIQNPVYNADFSYLTLTVSSFAFWNSPSIGQAEGFDFMDLYDISYYDDDGINSYFSRSLVSVKDEFDIRPVITLKNNAKVKTFKEMPDDHEVCTGCYTDQYYYTIEE